MIKSISKTLKYLLQVKAVKENLERESISVVFVTNSESEVAELAAYIGMNKNPVHEHFTHDALRNLNEELMKKIETADLVVIYSKKPLSEAPQIAYSLSIVRMLTFRYLCVLYGEGSSRIEKLIASSTKASRCKVISVESKTELIERLKENILKVVPLDALPRVLDFEIYDGFRSETALRLIFLNLVKVALIYRTLPIISFPYLVDYVAALSALVSKIDVENRAWLYASYAFPALFALAKDPKKKKRRLQKILTLVAAVSLALTVFSALRENDD